MIWLAFLSGIVIGMCLGAFTLEGIKFIACRRVDAANRKGTLTETLRERSFAS